MTRCVTQNLSEWKLDLVLDSVGSPKTRGGEKGCRKLWVAIRLMEWRCHVILGFFERAGEKWR